MQCWKFAGIAVLVGMVSSGCESTDSASGTTGRVIALKTQLEIQERLTEPLTNSLGWSVTLSKAYLSIGALYYYAGDPVLSHGFSVRRPNAFAWLSDVFVKTAHAHPGHYIEGAAMGQMLVPTTVDLLNGSMALADGDGVTGPVHSARFTWQSPPQGELASKLEGHVVLVQGIAAKDGVSIQFIAKADATEVLDGDQKVEVAGCAFGAEPGMVGVQVDGDGTVTLTLVPSVWFDQVDFGYVVAGASGASTPNAIGVVDIADTLAWQGFIRGVKKGTAYQFSYRK